MTIIADRSSTRRGCVIGRNAVVTDSSGLHPMDKEDYPYVVNNDEGQLITSKIFMEKGDIIEFELVWDGTNYYAYMLAHRE
jgi:hypothetical protein